MKGAQVWFDEYGESHRNATNKAIHWICVPLIYWSAYAFVTAAPTPGAFQEITVPVAGPLNWGLLALLAVQIYYFVLSPKLGFGLLLFNILVVWVTAILAIATGYPIWQLALGVFVLAWIGQFIGHHVEGAKPSFFKDLQFLLIGPAWLMGFIYRRLKLDY